MWRSRIFWRTFASFGALWLIGLITLGALIEGRVRYFLMEEAKNALRTKAMLVRELVVATPDPSMLQDRIEKLREEVGTRITLVDEQGKVLGDSDRDPRRFDVANHLDRPEIQQSKLMPYGYSSERYSETVRQDMMYLALHLPESRVAFVRLALPQDTVQQPIRQVRRLVWSAAALIGLLGMLLAFYLAGSFIQPLRKLTQGAEKISSGLYGFKVFLAEADEFGDLARSFNQMSENLAVQFSQLSEDRQKLQAVLGGMVEGVIALDAQQSVLFANERAGQLLEFSVRQAVGKKLWEVVRLRGLQELVQSGLRDIPTNDEVTVWAGTDSRTLMVNISPLPGGSSGGDPSRGVVVVLHDTTKLRRLERLRQDFVANVSHELKTPLSVIKANVETLLEGAAEDPAHRTSFLTRIAEQGDRLHALILDLLSLARIESGTEVFEFQKIVCNEIAQEVVNHFKSRAEARKQELRTEAPAGSAEVSAWADREAVQQILDNLVDNALKYTPDEGRITVRWYIENDYACLEVEDTGIGIPEPDLPRIFERFYRVDKARSREMGGTGLGLSIVKHLVQAMQGSVRAISKVGQGSKFTVRLPRTPMT
jgi:two-component system phosphate regulon sensor histidine kinase PhoR